MSTGSSRSLRAQAGAEGFVTLEDEVEEQAQAAALVALVGTAKLFFGDSSLGG